MGPGPRRRETALDAPDRLRRRSGTCCTGQSDTSGTVSRRLRPSCFCPQRHKLDRNAPANLRCPELSRNVPDRQGFARARVCADIFKRSDARARANPGVASLSRNGRTADRPSERLLFKNIFMGSNLDCGGSKPGLVLEKEPGLVPHG